MPNPRLVASESALKRPKFIPERIGFQEPPRKLSLTRIAIANGCSTRVLASSQHRALRLSKLFVQTLYVYFSQSVNQRWPQTRILSLNQEISLDGSGGSSVSQFCEMGKKMLLGKREFARTMTEIVVDLIRR